MDTRKQPAPQAPAAIDPKATEAQEAQRNAIIQNLSTYLQICVSNINNIESKMEDLEEHFNSFSSEDSKARDYLKLGSMGVGGVLVFVYLVLFLVYWASKSSDRRLSALEGMTIESAMLYGLWQLYTNAKLTPRERDFSLHKKISSWTKADFDSIESEYDDIIFELKALNENLHHAYYFDQGNLSLLYLNLDQEINQLKKEKATMTFDKAVNEFKNVRRIVNHAKHTMLVTCEGKLVNHSMFRRPYVDDSQINNEPSLRGPELV